MHWAILTEYIFGVLEYNLYSLVSVSLPFLPNNFVWKIPWTDCFQIFVLYTSLDGLIELERSIKSVKKRILWIVKYNTELKLCTSLLASSWHHNKYIFFLSHFGKPKRKIFPFLVFERIHGVVSNQKYFWNDSLLISLNKWFLNLDYYNDF